MKLKDREKISWFLVSMYVVLILLNAIWYMGGDHIKIAGENIQYIKSFGDALYFSIVTITTLGYGEMHPISSLGRIIVSLEVISGVTLLGIFLINISLTVVEDKERKRIETQKLSFQEQYKIWFENTIDALWNLCNEGLSYEERNSLSDNTKVRDYFKENNSQQWDTVVNNLDDNKYYRRAILHELEFLQRNIEILIMHVPIDNIDALNRLNNYIHLLYKMRKLDLNDYEERKVFIRRLWQLITLWDWVNGSYEKDYLLDTVNSL